jgi:hypothetical protein
MPPLWRALFVKGACLNQGRVVGQIAAFATYRRIAVQTLKTFAVAAVLAVAASGTATAAEKCSQKAFAGVLLVSTSTPQLCLIELNSKGDITESRCYLSGNFQTPIGSLGGSVAMSSSCKLSGEVTQKVGKKSEKVTLSGRGAASKEGNVFEATGTSKTGSYVIAGFQQW